MEKSSYSFIEGSITSPAGFKAGGVNAGLKKDRLDLALIYSEVEARASGVFTRNAVKGAPVIDALEKLKSGRAQAIIVNSGIANTGTGPEGLRDAAEMGRMAAAALGIPDSLVLVSSTGIIGERVPLELIERALPDLAERISPQGAGEAARAIMTTDSRPKYGAVEFEIDGRLCRIGGIAKGAGMIEPHMATMLAFLTTDTDVEEQALSSALKSAVNASFNRITVDGCMSTNDSVIIMANGLAGNRPILPRTREYSAFSEALAALCRHLARLVVIDGEGATKLIRVEIYGCGDDDQADVLARSVANSVLVKTAFFGNDPNWGRVLAAIGAPGINLTLSDVEISFNGIKVFSGGKGLDVDRAELAELIAGQDVDLVIKAGDGPGKAEIFTTDLSYDYVRINAEYHT